MLQGHLDMVCEKNNDVAFDFENEGLKLKVDGDSVSASGTTLGGDDGIAVAYALAILEDDTLEHPELEIVLTTDEEVGMKGTHALDVSDLKAACLINLDNECEGQILTACAGGMKNRGAFPVRFVEWEGLSGMLCIRGLKGGHSGAEIHCGRANANRLLGRLLFELNKALNVGVSELSGGMKDNAIPREAQAKIVIRPEDKKRFSEIVSEFEKNITDEFNVSDRNIRIEYNIETEESKNLTIIHPADMERILFMCMQCPNGVQTMSMELPGPVSYTHLLSEHAFSGAGSINKNFIEIAFKERHEIFRVFRQNNTVAYAAGFDVFKQRLGPGSADIVGHKQSGTLKLCRKGRTLSSRRRAHIQNPVAFFHRQHLGREHGARFLDIIKSGMIKGILRIFPAAVIIKSGRTPGHRFQCLSGQRQIFLRRDF